MSLKILHCAIFNEYDNAKFFYGLERKITHGLIQNGHFVYDFSYRDWERSLRFLGLKNSGLKKMNAKLIDICINLKPDVLLLSKAEKIFTKTILKIKEHLPTIKIAQWYVDHLEESGSFFENLNHIDCFFYANAKPLLTLSKRYKNAKFSFIPNISEPSIDSFKFKNGGGLDIIYVARDYKEDVRFKFAKMLDGFCKSNNIKYKIYASLGNEAIFGSEFQRVVANSKIAINFNRDDELLANKSDKFLGASDRMAQFMGIGTCTFSPRINGFERFFEDEKDIVYFDSPDDCFKKIKEYLSGDKFIKIAKNGQDKAIKLTNAKRVSKFMTEVIFDKDFSEIYEWQDLIYKNGDRL